LETDAAGQQVNEGRKFMAIITKTTCDECGVEVADRYDRPGWIHMDPAPNISISAGRKKDRTAQTRYFAGRSVAEQLDFCGEACLCKWLGKLKP
jgi:hypothetical protein